MTIAELIFLVAHANRQDDLMALNDGAFPSDEAPRLRIGLTTELFFNSLGDPVRKEATLVLAEEYYRTCDPPPNLLVQEDDSARLRTVADIRRVLSSSRTDDPTVGDLKDELSDPARTLSFYLRALLKGNKPSSPAYGNFACLIDGEGYRGGGSFINYNDRIASATGATDAFVASFVQRCEAFDVHYASSGLALLFSTYSGYAQVEAFPLFQRFPGLLHADSGTFSRQMQRRNDAIRDVNWLTAINQAMFDRVGGEAAAADLGPDIVRHPYPGGVVFQAGALPRLGDANGADVPQAYQRVARFLGPLRFEGWTAPFYLRTPSGVDRGTATQAWLTRFD